MFVIKELMFVDLNDSKVTRAVVNILSPMRQALIFIFFINKPYALSRCSDEYFDLVTWLQTKIAVVAKIQ